MADWISVTARLLQPAVNRLYRAHTSIGGDKVSPLYDATGHGARLAAWRTSRLGASSVVQSAGPGLVSKSRDTIRKNPLAANAVERYVTNVVGTGIKPQPLHPDPNRRREIKEAWKRFVDEADAHGCTNFYGLQAMAVRGQFEGGDAFGRLRARRAADGLHVPFQVELLESDMLPYDKSHRLSETNLIRSGIEFDGIGRRVAYHFWREHPHEMVTRGGNQIVRVPADTVVHVFKPLRIGQVRGVPNLSTTLLLLYELDQWFDAAVVRQKIAAMFSVSSRRNPAPLNRRR